MPRPVNALIIDDEPHVRVLLVSILKQLGLRTVWEAGDGNAGLGQVALHKPDVVLLDLNLPQISGLEVLEKIRAENPELPVIIVSAQSTMRTVSRAKELGAIDFVVKYAPKSEVVEMLSRALDKVAGEVSGETVSDGEMPPAPL